MTKAEAIQAMKEGKRVTHRHFTDDEWMETDESGMRYTLEDGVKCNYPFFWLYREGKAWEDGYSIHPSNTK